MWKMLDIWCAAEDVTSHSSHIANSIPALRTSKMPPASSTSQRSQPCQRLHPQLNRPKLGARKWPRPMGWDLRIPSLCSRKYFLLLAAIHNSSITKQNLLKKGALQIDAGRISDSSEHFEVSLCVRRQIWHLRSKWTQPLPQCHAGPGNLRREQLKILKQKPMYISSSIISLSLSLFLSVYLPIHMCIYYIKQESMRSTFVHMYICTMFFVWFCVCVYSVSVRNVYYM